MAKKPDLHIDNGVDLNTVKSMAKKILRGVKKSGKGSINARYTSEKVAKGKKFYKKIDLAKLPPKTPSVTPLSSSACAGVTPDLDLELPGVILHGKAITSQTLVGVSRFNPPPYSHGNCFSMATVEGPELRIINFKCENLEALMAMPAPLTFPITIRRLEANATVAVIDDHRIPEAWYDQHWCETCCPNHLLPLPQRLARARSILAGRVKRSSPIEDGALKGMVIESRTIGGIQGRQILIPALQKRLEAIKAVETAWHEDGWPETYQPLLDALVPAIADYLRAVGYKLPATLSTTGDSTGGKLLRAYLMRAQIQMKPNGFRIINWFHDRLETTCWKGTQPWEPKWP